MSKATSRDRLDALRALLNGHDGDYRLEADGRVVNASPEVIADLCNRADLRLFAVTPDGKVVFFWKLFDDVVDEDEWMGMKPGPAVVLRKGDKLLICFALDESVEATDVVVKLGCSVDRDFADVPIPMPGTDGWRLVRADPNAFHTLEEIIRLHGVSADPREGVSGASAEEDAPPWELTSYGEYGDAVIRAPYDAADPTLAREMIVTLGERRESNHWKPVKLPLGAFIAKLCKHEVGKKDGHSVVLADMLAGRRLNNSVKAINGLGIDIDTGMQADVIDAALLKFGCLAVRYTTHSNATTKTLIKRDTVVEKMGTTKITTEILREYLRIHEEWVPEMVASAEYEGTDHTERGIQVVATHQPMPKNRIVIPFAQSFVIEDEGDTQKAALAKWKEIPARVAEILGVPLDKACLEAARLFYLPRHEKNRPFDIALFGGPLFDWTTLDLGDSGLEGALKDFTGESKKSGGPSTPAGKELGRWAMKMAHGFQIAQAIEDFCPERIRHEKAPGQLEVECPFDEEHSNAGDPEDRAFFCVNAGDGDGEVFFARCRHDSCQKYNNLDHLAKMVSDGWFDRGVLEDPVYNIAEPEDAPNGEAAKKIAAEDQAREKYKEAIAALTPKSEPEERISALNTIYDANLKEIQRDVALSNFKAALKLNQPQMKRYIEQIENERGDAKGVERLFSGDVRTQSGGHRILFYSGAKPDQIVATKFLHETLKEQNKSEPIWSTNGDDVVRMQRKDGRINFTSMKTNEGFSAVMAENCSFAEVPESPEDLRRDRPDNEFTSKIFHNPLEYLPLTPELRRAPTFAKDGSVLAEDGWYPDLNAVVDLGGFTMAPVSEDPTDDELAHEVDLIVNDLLGDFSFFDRDKEGEVVTGQSLANAVAMLLTPFMRDMFEGPAPCKMIVKPQPQTGGTLLANIAIYLHTGDFPEATVYPDSEAERQKIITTMIKEGDSFLLFDDVPNFDSGALRNVFTAKMIQGRLLGGNTNVRAPNRFDLYATGNNPPVSYEMGRRLLWIKLNAQMTDLNARDFRHADLAAHVAANRAKYVHALLTMIKAWVVAGQPSGKVRPLASFEGWSAAVGGVLEHCGIEGFLENRATANRNRTDDDINLMLERWAREFRTPTGASVLADWIVEKTDLIKNDADPIVEAMALLDRVEGRAVEVGKKTLIVTRSADDKWLLAPKEDLTEPEKADVVEEIADVAG